MHRRPGDTPPRTNPAWWVAAALGAFLLATTRWTGAGVEHPWSHDVVNYERLAAAAPGSPGGPEIASVFTERIGFHYLVGLFSDATGLSLHTSYHLAATLCVVLVVFLAAQVFGALDLPSWIFVLGLATFLLAAYSDIRDVIQSPGSVTDLAFVLGVATVLLGLLRVNVWIVLAGVLVGIVARQSMLVVALAAAAWMLLDPAWQAAVADRRRRIAYAGGAVVLAAVTYLAIKAAVAPFTKEYAPDSPGESILLSPGSPKELAAHFARCAIAVAIPALSLVAVVAILKARGVALRALPHRLWLSLLVFAAIVIQPIVVSPHFTGFAHNEQRLAGFGLLPLCVALAIALQEARRREAIAEPTRPMLAGMVALLALASAVQESTYLGPGSLSVFLLLQAIACAGMLAAIALLSRTGQSSATGLRVSPQRSG